MAALNESLIWQTESDFEMYFCFNVKKQEFKKNNFSHIPTKLL
jgi:hypothetical protein